MIYSIQNMELSLSIEADTFKELLNNAKENAKMSYCKVRSTEYGYFDEALLDKGVKVEYHNGNKRKVKLIVVPDIVLENDDPVDSWKPSNKNISMLLENLDELIKRYFEYEYELKDFKLSQISFAGSTKFESTEEIKAKTKVAAYIRMLNSIGYVKNYSPKFQKSNKQFDKERSFDLVGNSNGIELSIFDKKAVTGMKGTKGTLCVVVRLTSQDAIRGCTDYDDTVKRIADLAANSMNICAKVILKIIPFGDNVKHLRAKKIIEEKVADKTMKKKMLRLVELIPIKKSLLLAQKQLNDRNIDEIMTKFASIGLSPVCISKRQEIEYLENLYAYL